MCLGDCQIVDVDFAAPLLQLVEYISDQAADSLIAVARGQRDDMVLGEDAAQIGLAGRPGCIAGRVSKRGREQRIQIAHPVSVIRPEPANVEAHAGTCCEMQWKLPPPVRMWSARTPIATRSGNSAWTTSTALRSLAAPYCGTTTAALPM